MQVKGYPELETNNLMLQMQVYQAIQKIKGEVSLHPKAAGTSSLLAQATVLTVARPALKKNMPQQAAASVVAMNGINAGILPSLTPKRMAQKTLHQVQISKHNNRNCKAVHTQVLLELYLRGMYIMYPYLEYLYDRVLCHIRNLITTKTNTKVLHMLLLVAQLRVQLICSHPHGKLQSLILRTTFCIILNGNHLATQLLSTVLSIPDRPHDALLSDCFFNTLDVVINFIMDLMITTEEVIRALKMLPSLNPCPNVTNIQYAQRLHIEPALQLLPCPKASTMDGKVLQCRDLYILYWSREVMHSASLSIQAQQQFTHSASLSIQAQQQFTTVPIHWI